MMRRFWAALSFLTRFPVPRGLVFQAEDVGRAVLLFPVVGALLGLLLAGLAMLLLPFFPAPLVALLLLVASALATGALHLDAVADMADGFGGGRTRDDVLRIMRDHVIGAYGAVCLFLVLGLKLVSLSYLLARGEFFGYLVVCPAVGRWASAPLSFFLPYARREGGLGAALTSFVGPREVLGSSLCTALIAALFLGWRGAWVLLLAGLIAASLGRWCQRRIQGITGDTLGATTEVCETLGLVLGVALGAPSLG
jgi:cobalamin 5'-phosphate synthase/cobalamin synthase